jgi:hypothetical protein
VGTYILFGGFAGGIFFREFERLHEGFAGYGAWAAYATGVLGVLGGLSLIAVASAEVERDLEIERDQEKQQPIDAAAGAPPQPAPTTSIDEKKTLSSVQPGRPPPLVVETPRPGGERRPPSLAKQQSASSRASSGGVGTPSSAHLRQRSAANMPTPLAISLGSLQLKLQEPSSTGELRTPGTGSGDEPDTPAPRSTPSRSPGPSHRRSVGGGLFLEPMLFHNRPDRTPAPGEDSPGAKWATMSSLSREGGTRLFTERGMHSASSTASSPAEAGACPAEEPQHARAAARAASCSV